MFQRSVGYGSHRHYTKRCPLPYAREITHQNAGYRLEEPFNGKVRLSPSFPAYLIKLHKVVTAYVLTNVIAEADLQVEAARDAIVLPFGSSKPAEIIKRCIKKNFVCEVKT